MTTKSVLIADDDSDLADLLAIRIKGLGLKVQAVYDGLATKNALQDDPPDLLILDVRMPAGNGLDVCETMALDPELSRIPILIITGLNDPITIARCYVTGAQYVFKAPDLWHRLEPLIIERLGISSGCTGGGDAPALPVKSAQEQDTQQRVVQRAV
jgi:CheY-like chemotaxis protein